MLNMVAMKVPGASLMSCAIITAKSCVAFSISFFRFFAKHPKFCGSTPRSDNVAYATNEDKHRESKRETP